MRKALLLLLFVYFVSSGYAQNPTVGDCIDTGTSCRGNGARVVSGTNAANTVTINAPNYVQLLVIHAVCSAGTAALTVSVSVDNANYLTIDTLTAAASQIKFYQPATLGAGIQLSPLGFRYIRLSMATCGAGNTSTMTVGIKGT